MWFQDTQAIEAHVSVIMSQLPADKDHLEAYSKAQADDPVCSHLIHVCHNGWPERHKVKAELLRYWPARTDLSICEDLLLYGTRIVVPKELQHQTLCKIHHGHQGIERCRLRVTTSCSLVAWSFITNGDICTPMFYLCTRGVRLSGYVVCMTTSSHKGTNAPFSTSQISLGKGCIWPVQV